MEGSKKQPKMLKKTTSGIMLTFQRIPNSSSLDCTGRASGFNNNMRINEDGFEDGKLSSQSMAEAGFLNIFGHILVRLLVLAWSSFHGIIS